MYTEQQVMAAHYASRVDSEARANNTTAQAIIAEEVADFEAANDELSHSKYEEGRIILGKARLEYTPRFRADGEGQVLLEALAKKHTMVSPAIRILSGHIATDTAYRYVALVGRNNE
jgi:N-acetylglucosamine kinase-like BadF-type ATPase